MVEPSREKQALALALRALRKEKEISQEGLAHESGLDRAYVGAIERGQRNPSYEVLLKLAGGLTVGFSDLAKRVEKELKTAGK